MMDGYGFFSYDGDMGWQFTQTGRDGLRIVLSHLQGPGANTWYLEGQQVASCGSTGRLSAGPHIHIDGTDPPRILAVFDL